MDIRTGRWAARAHEGTVVLLIGMRISRWLAVRQWLPAAAAMQRLLREPDLDPEIGLLGARVLYDPPRGATIVQYWRSAAHLRASAADRGHADHPAWTAFFRAAYRTDAVGVWHETYAVGVHESAYVNMPEFGLGAAGSLAPLSESGDRAAGRMRAADRAVVRR